MAGHLPQIICARVDSSVSLTQRDGDKDGEGKVIRQTRWVVFFSLAAGEKRSLLFFTEKQLERGRRVNETHLNVLETEALLHPGTFVGALDAPPVSPCRAGAVRAAAP